jgi:regulator of protease activity HflC (stomatin/prohibitin superfamily)
MNFRQGSAAIGRTVLSARRRETVTQLRPLTTNMLSLGSSEGTSSGSDGRRLVSAPRWHVGVVVVPQQIAWVVERLGKFHKTLEPGLHFLVPVVDRVSYAHSLKEESMPIPNQQAITKDNVTISIDGVLFLRVLDPYQASYGVHEPIQAVTQLAQTTMRSEIGKMTLDKTFEERDTLNAAIVSIVNEAARGWGVQVMRYEIRDILPPQSIKQAMEMQAEAERRRRAEVLQSEGDRQSEVNLAQGQRQAAILRAEGEAQAILERAKATAEGIRLLSSAIASSKDGEKAAGLRVAEQYVAAWKEMARSSNTIVVPANPSDASSMVATAMSIFKQAGGDSSLPGSSRFTDIPPADGKRSEFGLSADSRDDNQSS